MRVITTALISIHIHWKLIKHVSVLSMAHLHYYSAPCRSVMGQKKHNFGSCFLRLAARSLVVVFLNWLNNIGSLGYNARDAAWRNSKVEGVIPKFLSETVSQRPWGISLLAQLRRRTRPRCRDREFYGYKPTKENKKESICCFSWAKPTV